jgi:hypothetical protein
VAELLVLPAFNRHEFPLSEGKGAAEGTAPEEEAAEGSGEGEEREGWEGREEAASASSAGVVATTAE